MFSAASVTGDSAERIQLRFRAMTVSTVAAKLAGVQTGLLPQTIPSSTSTRYFTSMLPVPTTSLPPDAPVNVPAPLLGTPSAAGAVADPVSPPAATVFFSVLLGLGLALRLALGEVDGDGLTA